MKTLFIPARGKLDIEKLKEIKIKNKFGLLSSVQYLHYLPEIKKYFKNSVMGGQILGCNLKNALKIKSKVKSYLYIGSAYFYPTEIALKTNIPVYIYNPLTEKFSQVSQTETETIKKQNKGKLIKFYSANKYGILVSTKKGQNRINEARKLQKKLKNSYIFIFNNLDTKELENFPDIDCWINTACPRIEYKTIINYQDIPKDYGRR